MPIVRYPLTISADTNASLDEDAYFIDGSAANVTLTLPDMTGMGEGDNFLLRRIDTNVLKTVTIAATGTTIEGAASITLEIRQSVVIVYSNSVWSINQSSNSKADQLSITIDGQFAEPAIGAYGTFSIPYSCIITGWTLFECSDTPISSSITIDVWKDVYASYPPTVADTIFGTKPSLSSATKNSATGLSIAVTAGDTFYINIDSVSTGQKFFFALQFTRTS